jgi:ribosomal protein S18 acetylase RimI-like enzyme
MNYTIRNLTDQDDRILWEMLQYAAHESSLEAVQQQSCLRRYVENWGRAGDTGCTATVNDRAIAAAWLRLWGEDDRGFGFVQVGIPELAIAVAPDYQGQGIGTQLLSRILEQAKEQFSAISLSVRADNRAARLYERMGFVELPKTAIENRTGGSSYTMIYKFERSPHGSNDVIG